VKILTCVYRTYYDDPVAINPNFYNFVTIPRAMGHSVTFFDHTVLSRVAQEIADDLLCSAVKGGNYDLVLIETGSTEFSRSALQEAKKYTVLLGFNSDDDFRWLDYSSTYADCYTYMITSYYHIYDYARTNGFNVIHSPWACSGMFDGKGTTKDIDFSFAGGVHGHRLKRLLTLSDSIPIKVFGKGSASTMSGYSSLLPIFLNKFRGGHGTRTSLRNWLLTKLKMSPDSISYKEANSIWSRSKISYTPLSLEKKHLTLKYDMAQKLGMDSTSDCFNPWICPYQVKGRVFDLGLSGTVMICDNNPMITRYYDPSTEYLTFESNEELLEKVKYYLSHENERFIIASNYHKRTEAQHLWKHRWNHIIKTVMG